MDFGTPIKIAMLQKGLKQVTLADKMGYSKQRLHALINGKDIGINQLQELINVIGYDVKIQLIDKDNGKVINIE